MGFKVGDIVKIIKRNRDNKTGTEDWKIKDGDVGKIGKITNCHTSGNWSGTYTVKSEDETKYYGFFSPEELQVMSNTTFEVGAILESEGYSADRKVLSVVFDSGDHELVVTEDLDGTYDVNVNRADDLEEDWGLKSDIKEVTLEEVAKSLGIEVKNLRIKE